MVQVTIEIDEGALQAAQKAAEREHLSLNQWFARFALMEKNRQSWALFFTEIDAITAPEDDGFPIPTEPAYR